MDQLSLFPTENNTSAAPPSATWNLWHGCTKVSPGCYNCYVYRRDSEYGKDTSIVHKTKAFNMPLSRHRSGPLKGQYKYPSGTTFYTCFTSDFFHKAADEWRTEAWTIIQARSDCYFYMVTKRPERIAAALPPDWGNGYDNVEISCTCENQTMANKRLPVFLSLPIKHKSIIHEPMLESIDIRPFLKKYAGEIECVSVGGESGQKARLCDFAWVLDSHMQCVEYGVDFHFHQTGASFKKGGKVYSVPREQQHKQAEKAGLDTHRGILISCEVYCNDKESGYGPEKD